jgi:hypothetical protein
MVHNLQLAMAFVLGHGVAKIQDLTQFCFPMVYITTWTFTLGLALAPQQHKMHLEQHIDLKKIIWLVLWSQPKKAM